MLKKLSRHLVFTEEISIHVCMFIITNTIIINHCTIISLIKEAFKVALNREYA
jgi:hypothetical protein